MATPTAQKAKAVVLFSGGLDSWLACEALRRAGVAVVALRHHSIFFPLKEGKARHLPWPLVTREVSGEMVELVRNPQHGYGKNANPCLDCKQMMYGLAWAEAQRQGADFIATGEVLGQRPMSQRADAFRLMERRGGVEGLVVRPLCGRLLAPTTPEQKGLIRRDDLLDITGRSRKRQLELAAEWGIEGFTNPAGGCKLTEPQYAERVFRLRDLGIFTLEALRAARHGRLFEMEGPAFALVGRSEADNVALLADAPESALMLELKDRPGPLACVMGSPSLATLDHVRRLVVRYSRFRDLGPDAVGAWSPEEVRARYNCAAV